MGNLKAQIKSASKAKPQISPVNVRAVKKTAESMRKRLDIRGKRQEIGF